MGDLEIPNSFSKIQDILAEVQAGSAVVVGNEWRMLDAVSALDPISRCAEPRTTVERGSPIAVGDDD